MGWLDYFRRWAKRYDRETESYGWRPGKLLDPFRGAIGRRERCLDVGCGTGRSMEALRGTCKRVAGVEPVERMARRAEERGYQVARLRGEELGRLEGEFDLITFFASIDYMDAGRAAAGCSKLLAGGGAVFLTVEPDNEARVKKAFWSEGFRVAERRVIRAYEGQDYVCLLLLPAEG